MQEIWLKLVNASKYEVSNLGGIKIKGVVRYATNKYQHRSVCVCFDNKTKIQTSLHRLVYTYFKHEIPPKMVINHIDGDKSNNRIDNLECITQAKNVKHAYDKGLYTTHQYEYFAKRKKSKK